MVVLVVVCMVVQVVVCMVVQVVVCMVVQCGSMYVWLYMWAVHVGVCIYCWACGVCISTASVCTSV